MKKLVAFAMLPCLAVLACSNLPPPSARTNPIYDVRHTHPPAMFKRVPATTPAPPPPKADTVADAYYPFSVWWNPNMWPGDAGDWEQPPRETSIFAPEPAVLVLHSKTQCDFTILSLDTYYFRPGMGDAPRMELLAEFDRQTQLMMLEEWHEKGFYYPMTVSPVCSNGPDQAGFTVRFGRSFVIRSEYRSDYSVSLAAAAIVMSSCPPSDGATERIHQGLTRAVADSLTFVRE